jgi:hypothetical protein
MPTTSFLAAIALVAIAPLSTAAAQPSTDSAPTAAEPAEPGPWLGIGLSRTLDGTGGPSLRIGRDVQLALVLGGGGLHFDDYRESRLDVAARVLVPLLHFDDGWVGVVGGVAGHRYRFAWDDLGSRTMWSGSAEAGLHAEWFVAPALSLGFEVGATAAVGGDVVDAPGEDSYTENGWHGSSLGRSGVAGAASITYWFGVDDEPRQRPAVRLGLGALAGVGGNGLTLALDAGRLRLELSGYRDAGDSDAGSWSYGSASVGALYEVARTGPVALSTGLRATLTRTADGNGEHTYGGGAVPLRLELDATSWLSVYAEGGLVASMNLDDSGLSGGSVGPTGAIGFTVWF